MSTQVEDGGLKVKLSDAILDVEPQKAFSIAHSSLNAANLPAPEVIAREIMENLESALTEFSAIVEALEGDNQQ